ncbi:MAG: glycosyltransferase family 4 protein [Solirubrobacterales bacterium]|nr:glycosyltransferase family 4 protein [Solirubrobacterales bacterium]
MRVLLDTTFALRGHSGTGVYLAHLVPALERLGVEVLEARDEARSSPGGGRARSARNLAAELRWANAELPRRARALGADVLHHPLPVGTLALGPPQVVTVHDLAFVHLPEAFDRGFRNYALLAHRLATRRAGAVVAVSQATADDLRAQWNVPSARIVVARHGPGQEPETHRPRAERPRHFLYVGDDEPRKNLGLLLAGYARYRVSAEEPLPLVLAGTAAPAPAEGVERVDRPDAERLAALYAEAAALVHPSLHEGFGLTPLEAMSAGTPVLAARSSGVEEVCGDAALYVEAYDAGGIATRLAELAVGGALRRDLSERGRRRAAEFSWTRSARAHLDAYALAIGGGGRT